MVSIDTHPLHNISWVDLASKDVDAAIEFYSGLFGWTTFNDGETPYSIFMAGDKPVGGIMGMTPEMGEMPAVWSTYVNVEDADAIIAAATAAGGSVYQPPFDIPGGGRIAVIGDPDGAALCLFEGNADNGLKALDEVGAPCWWDCMTRDAAGAKAFYTTVFGWGIEEIPEMNYTIFTNHGEYLCGTMAMPDDVPEVVPAHWAVNFVVADCDAAAEYVASNGGTLNHPPMDTPFGRACSVLDPWGSTLNIIDRSTATEG